MKIIVKRSNLQQPRRLTQSEFEALKPYEAHMKTALTSDWTRGLGRNGIKIMSEIRDAATGRRNFVNASCPVCVLKLVREVARMYNAYRDYIAAHPVKPGKPAKPSKPSKPAEEVEKPAQPVDDGFTVEDITIDAPPAVGVDEGAQEPADDKPADDGFTVEDINIEAPPAVGVSDENQEPAKDSDKPAGDEVPEGYYVEEITVDAPPSVTTSKKKTSSKKTAK